MAMFRGFTAEEEAASRLIYALAYTYLLIEPYKENNRLSKKLSKQY